ncbi:MAG: hypothetical protein MRY83_06625, partial [Flavobacteriales bacterium]|nr:hypothetical protein [Flavobacteriales bacterium]
MSTKLGLILLAFASWSVLCWKRYTCNIKGFCNGWTIWEMPNPISYEPKSLNSPILFHWSGENAVEGSSYDSLLRVAHENILAGKTLRIVGFYDKDEINESTFDNLGLARAENFRRLLSNLVDSNSVITDYKVFRLSQKFESQKFQAISLEWMEPIDLIVDQEFGYTLFCDKSLQVDFSSNDFDRLINRLMEESGQLDKLILVGHTDNVGTQEFNVEEGLKNANALKQILVDRGIDETMIEVVSKG